MNRERRARNLAIGSLVAVAIAAVMASCTSDIASITVPDVPEPGNIAGAWAGNARWDAVQGGASGAITSGAATAIIFQNGATILGSTWEVTGIYVGTLSGSVDPEGNATGTATVTVLAGTVVSGAARAAGLLTDESACSASAPWGGKLDGDQLAINASFADPGTVPCAGAPVGLTLNLSR